MAGNRTLIQFTTEDGFNSDLNLLAHASGDQQRIQELEIQLHNTQHRARELEIQLNQTQELLHLANLDNKSIDQIQDSNTLMHNVLYEIIANVNAANENYNAALTAANTENERLTTELANANTTINNLQQNEKALIESGKRIEKNNTVLRTTIRNQKGGLKDNATMIVNQADVINEQAASLKEKDECIANQTEIIATLQSKLKQRAQKRKLEDENRKNKKTKTMADIIKQEPISPISHNRNLMFTSSATNLDSAGVTSTASSNGLTQRNFSE
jgi:chromosome segregation ATPase